MPDGYIRRYINNVVAGIVMPAITPIIIGMIPKAVSGINLAYFSYSVLKNFARSGQLSVDVSYLENHKFNPANNGTQLYNPSVVYSASYAPYQTQWYQALTDTTIVRSIDFIAAALNCGNRMLMRGGEPLNRWMRVWVALPLVATSLSTLLISWWEYERTSWYQRVLKNADHVQKNYYNLTKDEIADEINLALEQDHSILPYLIIEPAATLFNVIWGVLDTTVPRGEGARVLADELKGIRQLASTPAAAVVASGLVATEVVSHNPDPLTLTETAQALVSRLLRYDCVTPGSAPTPSGRVGALARTLSSDFSIDIPTGAAAAGVVHAEYEAVHDGLNAMQTLLGDVQTALISSADQVRLLQEQVSSLKAENQVLTKGAAGITAALGRIAEAVKTSSPYELIPAIKVMIVGFSGLYRLLPGIERKELEMAFQITAGKHVFTKMVELYLKPEEQIPFLTERFPCPILNKKDNVTVDYYLNTLFDKNCAVTDIVSEGKLDEDLPLIGVLPEL